VGELDWTFEHGLVGHLWNVLQCVVWDCRLELLSGLHPPLIVSSTKDQNRLRDVRIVHNAHLPEVPKIQHVCIRLLVLLPSQATSLHVCIQALAVAEAFCNQAEVDEEVLPTLALTIPTLLAKGVG